MNLQSLSRRTGLPLRTLRYVVDHQMLPDLEANFAVSVGSPRVFDESEGFGLALAAFLLVAGMRRNLIEQIVKVLTEEGDKKRPGIGSTSLLCEAFEADDAELEIVDGVKLEVTIGNSGTRRVLLGVDKRIPASKPHVVRVRVDLAQLSRLVIKDD